MEKLIVLALAAMLALPATPSRALDTDLEPEKGYVSRRLQSLPPLDVETLYGLGFREPTGQVRARGKPRGIVALTFDTEIPNGQEAHETLASVLDTLREAGVRATFFVVGAWARANPSWLRQMEAQGHEIANHSFSHRPFSGRSEEEITHELGWVDEAVRSATGRLPTRLFRPPYGCIDEVAYAVVADQGYEVVGWSVSGEDASRKTETAEEVLASLGKVRSGDIILLHTNRRVTAQALPRILEELASRGLEAVRVTELLAAREGGVPDRSKKGLRRCGTGVAGLGSSGPGS
ncbi:MAG: hypothetical protein KatS3mg076_2338 [Candidatus Binatia bacterium]|nr:MAG: hypothetical protein KatS3mg076_2338 [Candidatus Binatia bacterium]